MASIFSLWVLLQASLRCWSSHPTAIDAAPGKYVSTVGNQIIWLWNPCKFVSFMTSIINVTKLYAAWIALDLMFLLKSVCLLREVSSVDEEDLRETETPNFIMNFSGL